MPREQTLTEKHKLFARTAVANPKWTGDKIAIESGYSEKGAHVTASRLLNNAKIQNYMKTLQNKTANKLEITYEMCLRALWDNHKLALAPDGETGKIDVRASSDALKEVNKMLGNHAPEKRELSGSLDIVSDFGEGDEI